MVSVSDYRKNDEGFSVKYTKEKQTSKQELSRKTKIVFNIV